MIVHITRLVSENDAKIHALMRAERTQNATLLLIQHSVIVCLATEAMLSPDAQYNHPNVLHSIYASHHHVARIQCVLSRMASRNVAAFHLTLEMLTVLDADPNVFTIPIVRAEWLAFASIAEILAQAYAVHSPSVALSITFQFVHAQETMKAIHLPAADLFQRNVSNSDSLY